MFNQVAIVGLGLIGGSLGLALHKSKAAKRVVGYDLGVGVSDRAMKVGAIDEYFDSLTDAVRGAELVVLATPVGPMRSLLQSLSSVLTPGTIVTDVASTKSQIINWAEEFLPANVSFVGGHPMAGKEVSGVDAADADLFVDCIYCITPTPKTRSEAISRVVSFVESLGARLRFMDPSEHDGEVAGVSHLPFLASIALMDTIASDPSWGDASQLAATGFRDATRLSAGNPEMYRDICATNGSAIVRWLDLYVSQLNSLRDRVAMRDRSLSDDFARVQERRQEWQLSHDQRQ